MKGKRNILMLVLLSFIGILMLNLFPVHAASTTDVTTATALDNNENLPTWSTVVNTTSKHYNNVEVDVTLSGRQSIIPQTIQVEEGHMTNGKFVTDKTISGFKDYTISGNKVTFKLSNIDSPIQITYKTSAHQTGLLSNATTVTEDGNTSQKISSMDYHGYGYLFSGNQSDNYATTSNDNQFAAVSGVTGNTASSATITDSNGNVVSHSAKLNKYKSYNVTWNWSIPNGEQIKAGDTITFTLPSNVQVESNITFNVTQGPNGPVIGTFTINKGSNTGTLTFNSYLQDHPETNRHGVISIEANGTENDNATNYDWDINKVGWVNSANQPTWNVVVNPQCKKYSSLTITDTMSNGQTIVPGSIVIEYGHYNSQGQFVIDKEDTDPTNYTINGNQITFHFTNVDSAIQIVYNTKTDQSGILHNQATVSMTNSQGNTTTANNSAQISYSGKGSMTGDNVSSSSSSSSSSKSSMTSSSKSIVSERPVIRSSSSSLISSSVIPSSSSLSSMQSSSLMNSSSASLSQTSSKISSSVHSSTVPVTSSNSTAISSSMPNVSSSTATTSSVPNVSSSTVTSSSIPNVSSSAISVIPTSSTSSNITKSSSTNRVASSSLNSTSSTLMPSSSSLTNTSRATMKPESSSAKIQPSLSSQRMSSISSNQGIIQSSSKGTTKNSPEIVGNTPAISSSASSSEKSSQNNGLTEPIASEKAINNSESGRQGKESTKENESEINNSVKSASQRSAQQGLPQTGEKAAPIIIALLGVGLIATGLTISLKKYKK